MPEAAHGDGRGLTRLIENFYFNLGLPQFAEKAVREAVHMSMDKASIIKELYYGSPQPAQSYLPPACWAYNANLPKQA